MIQMAVGTNSGFSVRDPPGAGRGRCDRNERHAPAPGRPAAPRAPRAPRGRLLRPKRVHIILILSHAAALRPPCEAARTALGAAEAAPDTSEVAALDGAESAAPAKSTIAIEGAYHARSARRPAPSRAAARGRGWSGGMPCAINAAASLRPKSQQEG